MPVLRTGRLATACTIAAFVVVGACSKGETHTDTASGTAATATPAAASAFSVLDIDMGRHIDADKKISDKTDDFAPMDTIYASVHTTGAAANATVIGKWMFENGTPVGESTVTLSPTGDSFTEFHIAKPTGWPKGKYTIHIMIDGKEVRTKDVTVK